MPFVRTSPYDRAEGYLACDWLACPATSPMFRMHLGPLPVDGWDVVLRREQMRTLVEYFCSSHAPAARARLSPA